MNIHVSETNITHKPLLQLQAALGLKTCPWHHLSVEQLLRSTPPFVTCQSCLAPIVSMGNKLVESSTPFPFTIESIEVYWLRIFITKKCRKTCLSTSAIISNYQKIIQNSLFRIAYTESFKNIFILCALLLIFYYVMCKFSTFAVSLP